jgi:hypothetical protein
VDRSSQANEALAAARQIADEISASLPKSVPAGGLTLRSKLPFKALSVRELLIHRVSVLASAAVIDFEEGAVVPGIVLTRAVIETTAVLFCLAEVIDEFLSSKDEAKLDKSLMQSLVGARWPDHPVQSTNVLNLVDRVSKSIPGYRASYDTLSEYVHPNWSGLLGSFGRIDRERHELFLGFREDSAGLVSGASALAATLDVFRHFYNAMAKPLHDFNEYFDAQSQVT